MSRRGPVYKLAFLVLLSLFFSVSNSASLAAEAPSLQSAQAADSGSESCAATGQANYPISEQTASVRQGLEKYASINSNLPLLIARTAPDRYRISAGSRFVVLCRTELKSPVAKVGDAVTVTTVDDLCCDGQIVIPKSTLLEGCISDLDGARHCLDADLPGKHWLNAQGSLGLQFKQIDLNGSALSLNAAPAVHTLVDTVGPANFQLVTDKNGMITVFYGSSKYACMTAAFTGASLGSGTLAHEAASLALRRLSFFLVPVASGLAGAASPSYALGHPAEDPGLKERSKGFMLGFAKGLPGGGLLMSAVEHGSDLSIASGDRFVVELRDDLEFSTK